MPFPAFFVYSTDIPQLLFRTVFDGGHGNRAPAHETTGLPLHDLLIFADHKAVLVYHDLDGFMYPVRLFGVTELIEQKPGTVRSLHEQFYDLCRLIVDQNAIVHISVNRSLDLFSVLFYLDVTGHGTKRQTQCGNADE